MALFGWKQPKHNPDEIIKEKWKTSFNWLSTKRFTEEQSDSYSSFITHGALSLELYKKNLFAWVTSPLYKYSDFLLEARTTFGTENGYAALGFILRHLDDSNFYYFLISNKGFFRFDVVRNGSPLSLIEWTRSPVITEESNSLRILSHLDNFAFFVDDAWIGEVCDDSIREGHIGFAGQNYEASETANFYLNDFLIESRSMEVEKAYTRWVTYIPADPDYRVNLAQTFYRRGRLIPAAIQMRKALKFKRGTYQDYFFLTGILVQLGLFQEALEACEKSLSLDAASKEAKEEKANLLYLLNKFPAAKTYINCILPDFKDNPLLWNQLGNIEFALGNWEQAKAAYLEAIQLDPQMALFKVNAAHALEVNGDVQEALRYYLEASRQFFKEEAYDELERLFPKLELLAPDDTEVLSLEGKILFHREEYDEAAALFEEVLEEACDDSAVYFLYGLILVREDECEEALPFLQKACELEPQFSTYWLRLAETLFQLGEDPEQALITAYTLNPADPWINNLYGLYLSSLDKDQEAMRYFEKAYELKPQEVDIIINYTDCLTGLEPVTHTAQESSSVETRDSALQDIENDDDQVIPAHAFSIIKKALQESEQETAVNPLTPADKAKLLNHWGNLLVYYSRYNQAYLAYERALKIEPENIDYLKNCASLCIELDMIMMAEELLTRLFDLKPTADVYNLVANLALIKGESNRAEMALKAGLEEEPGNADLKLNLLAFYIQTGNYEKAKEALEQAAEELTASGVATAAAATTGEQSSLNQREQGLLDRFHDKFEKKLVCADCGRIWWAPLNLPPQPPFKLHGEPPGECPAGKCPSCNNVYCIACASGHLVESRFVCKDCDQLLKIGDDYLKFLILQHVKVEAQ